MEAVVEHLGAEDVQVAEKKPTKITYVI